MRVEISQQVADFIRKQSPEPRRRLRKALEELRREKGDIKSLEGPLADYYRLRVYGYRIIFAYELIRGRRCIRCIFAEKRNLIYEVFADLLREFEEE